MVAALNRIMNRIALDVKRGTDVAFAHGTGSAGAMILVKSAVEVAQLNFFQRGEGKLTKCGTQRPRGLALSAQPRIAKSLCLPLTVYSP